MARSEQRARDRRRRLATRLREAVIGARNADAEAAQMLPVTPGDGELWKLLQDIDRSGERVWQIVTAIDCTEDEWAMIAQVVAPYLAAMSRVSSRLKHARA